MSNLLEQASLVLIPSGYKEDVVYSEIPLDGSGDMVFSRSSNGTRVNSAGLVEVTPWNLVQYSEEFNNALYNKVNISVTSNNIIAPNGTTTADKIESTSSSGAVEMSQIFTLIGSQSYCASVYLKKGSGNTQMNQFDVYNGSGNYVVRIAVNFGTGTITQSVGTGATIENVGGDWYKIIAPFTGYAGTNYIYIGSSGDNFPSGQYVYAWGAQLNIGSTAKTYFPTTDRLNVPRLTYQNGGGGCPSLLLEKQSTNIVTYSEQFDNAAWTQYQGSTITANSIISPDGTQNADTLTVASGQTYSGVYQTISGSSDVYTVSIFAKYNTKRWLFFFDASAIAQGWFDIQNGVLGTITVGYTGTIENFGNGWYRCSFKKNTAGTPAFFQIGLVDANGSSVPVSNGSSYIWGAQAEASSYFTSYIPTTTASATRVADACFKTGISSLIGQTEGVVFVDLVMKNNISSVNRVVSITESDWLNGGSIRIDIQSGNITASIVNNGIQIGTISSNTAFAQNTRYKIAIAYKTNDCALYMNGTQLGTNTSVGTMPTCSEFYLNELGGGFGGPWQPTEFNQAILFPTRLTNAELASLTTL